MRLFIAIEIPENIRTGFASLLKEFRAIAPQVKWVRAENLHVTLKFLGETDSAKLGALQNVLSTVRSPDPVSLEFRGLGFFPNDKRPRVFWAGMEASANLKSLAADVDQAVHQLGFSREERPYAPHLTLARIPLPDLPSILLQLVKEKSSLSFGSIRTTEFRLIESKLKPAGAEYTTVRTFRFALGG
ncbi:MAG TPA: RNA 2',3'-cyclic phosphodiesterase [Candidatus Acidoferrum sp.]|nr:RNA 2',3'-cyclic phosphodiesterase [Candidatus Acidoferrum sp.]